MCEEGEKTVGWENELKGEKPGYIDTVQGERSKTN